MRAGWRAMSPGMRFGIGIMVLMIVLSIVVPALSPYDTRKGGPDANLPPSGEYWFGTDHLGRDVFARTFEAARIDIILAAAAVSVPLLVGTIVGSIIGITRSRLVQNVGDLAIEVINSFPTLIIVIALVAAFGRGTRGILLGLFITAWARYAKVARARALIIRDMDYLEAGRCLGYSRARILSRHVAPNVFPLTLAYAVSDFVVVIGAIAGLSFLGAGVQPPTPEWGAMLNDARLHIFRAWWPVLFPGIMLSITALGVSLISQALGRRTSENVVG
ncbi:MAG: ABC transporter permease [Acidimicrobiia bacterium]|nr:ABC transporter permease [Acidimicrobiia bacterium]